jgi:hypothetical protein
VKFLAVGHFATAERPKIVLFPRQKSVFSRFRGLDVRFAPCLYSKIVLFIDFARLELLLTFLTPIWSLFCVPAESRMGHL